MQISMISSGVMPTFRALRTCARTCGVISWMAATVNVAMTRYLRARPGRFQMEPYRLSVVIRYISGANSYAMGRGPLNILPSPPARRARISKPCWNRSSKVAIMPPFSTMVLVGAELPRLSLSRHSPWPVQRLYRDTRAHRFLHTSPIYRADLIQQKSPQRDTPAHKRHNQYIQPGRCRACGP